MTRNYLRKKLVRNIKKRDIEYKNLPMMTKFLNDIGKLKNRYQTRLHSPVQRKVARTIKKMRAQFLLPTVGVLKPTDKIALGSYLEDVEEMHKKTIDPVTGRLFLKYSLQDDLRQKLEREREWMEDRFGHIETEQEYAKVKAEADAQAKIIREMSVDNDQVLPNERTRHWMLAQSHIMMRDGQDEELAIASRVSKAVSPDNYLAFEAPSDHDKACAKTAYDVIQDKIKQRDLNSDNLFADLISEKAYDLDRVSTTA